MKELVKFKELGLSDETLKALHAKGFEEPTDIQAKCIPLLLQQNINVVGQAQTGTGKTAAFTLPILEVIDPKLRKVQAIILAPTRELAIQVAEEINSLKGSKNLSVIPIYGGQSIDQQFRQLKKGVHIVVGTPGRVIDHLQKKTLDLKNVQFFVLDEADEMLNMGFIEDIEKIMSYVPDSKRTLLFSATMPKRILGLVKKYMPNYEHVKVEKQQLTSNLTDQIYFEVTRNEQFESLSRIIDMEKEFYGLIFCRTRVDVDRLAHRLIGRGYSAEGIHGDISQNQREKIFARFKSKQITILAATDVAARGLDVNDLTHVINYSLPQDPENYVHRIGRTGRAGKQGTAITFITPAEYRKLVFIQKATKTDIRKEKLPGVKEIIEMKKERIVSDIKEIIASQQHAGFEQLALTLTKEFKAEDVIGALLKQYVKDELDESNYSEIRQSSVDTKGKNRLFVAMGSRDGLDKKQLADLITEKTGVKSALIEDIKMFDVYSFVTVPFAEAEVIIRAFQSLGRDNRPMITKANKGGERGKRFGYRKGGRRSGSSGSRSAFSRASADSSLGSSRRRSKSRAFQGRKKR